MVCTVPNPTVSTALFSTVYQKSWILRLLFRHRDTISGSSSSDSPMDSAPMLIRARAPPWYPSASSATFPFPRSAYSGLPFLIFSIGTPNMVLAEASYIFPCVRNTSSLHSSPASHASTRASMAEKSATRNRFPSPGMKAVRISWDSKSGTSPQIAFMASSCRSFTNRLARARFSI